MNTRKIIIVVISIVAVLGAIVVIFVGGIVGSVFYGIHNSEAANTSREFLRSNEQLKQDIGEVQDFGWLVSGNININSGVGTAQLSLKVYGSRKTVNANVELTYSHGRPWRVTAASYRNDEGQTINLLNPYEVRRRLVQPLTAVQYPPSYTIAYSDIFPTRVIARLPA